MKTAKEFYRRLSTDEAFTREFADKLTAKREAGASSSYETVIPVAAEFGYELTRSDVDDMNNASEELSEEDLGKIAGGSACVTWILAAVATTISLCISLEETLSVHPDGE